MTRLSGAAALAFLLVSFASQAQDRILAPDGSNAAPSFSFSSAPGTGFYKRRDGDGQGFLFAAGANKGVIGLTSLTLALASLHEIVWSSAPTLDTLASVTNDVRLGRDGPGVLRLIAGGSNFPGLRIYNAYSGSSTTNFERFAIHSAPDGVVVRTEAAGSGALRTLQLGTGANTKWAFDAQGNFGRAASPSVASCGATATVQGRDSGMVVTVGTGGTATSCAIGFGAAWANAPSCVANSSTDAAVLLVATTTTTVTVSTSSALTPKSKLHIHCAGV